MTAHNRHLLAEGAYKANREAAAREERARIVALLRLRADIADAVAGNREDTAAALDAYGHQREAANERREADTYTSIAFALRDAATHIEREAGQ